MNNKLSIISVVYNGRSTLEECLKSVDRLYDLGVDLEHVIVDGGSVDGTLDLIIEYGRSFRRLLSGPDNGLYDAMNKGMYLVSGSYFMFLNADDKFDSNLTKDCFSFLEDDESNIVVFGISQNNEKRTVRKWIPYSKNRSQPLWLEYPHPGFILRTEFWREQCILFNIDYKICADLDFMLRHRIKTGKVLIKNKVLVNMLLGGVSTKLSNKVALNIELYDIYKKVLHIRYPGFYLFLRYLKKIKQYIL